MKLRQRAAVTLVTAASTVALAGCTVFSPAVTLRPYDPSDGKGTRVGEVDVRNALVVSGGVDQPGVLSVVLVNSSDADTTVTISADVDAGTAPSQTFPVAAGESLHIGNPTGAEGATTGGASVDGPAQANAWMQVPQVPAVPGETVPVTFSAGGDEVEVAAPVLLPCFEYAPLTPTAAPTAAAAPSPTASVACGPETGDNLQQADDPEENESGGEPEATPTEVAQGDTTTGIGGDTQADAEGTGEEGSGGQ